MAPYICIVVMTVMLRLGKAWSNVIAAVSMYGLCYSVLWVDRYKVTSAGEHVVPIVTFALVAIAGICTLSKYNTRLIHGLVGIFLLIACSVSLTSYTCGVKQLDVYRVNSQPDMMLPVMILVMISAGFMMFTKEA